METKNITVEVDLYTLAKLKAAARDAGRLVCDFAADAIEEMVDKFFSEVGSTNPPLPDGFNQPAA
jgi:hypothetical protein